MDSQSRGQNKLLLIPALHETCSRVLKSVPNHGFNAFFALPRLMSPLISQIRVLNPSPVSSLFPEHQTQTP